MVLTYINGGTVICGAMRHRLGGSNRWCHCTGSCCNGGTLCPGRLSWVAASRLVACISNCILVHLYLYTVYLYIVYMYTVYL